MRTIAPGVTAHHTPGHTPGNFGGLDFQRVTVQDGREWTDA